MLCLLIPWICKLRIWWLSKRLFKLTDAASIGRLGEEIARLFLISKKYRIICRNWRYEHGEIDIIALDKLSNNVVFVEVKLRTLGTDVHGYFAVSREKKSILKQTCSAFLRQYIERNATYRFDIVSVDIDRNSRELKIHHYEDVKLFR